MPLTIPTGNVGFWLKSTGVYNSCTRPINFIVVVFFSTPLAWAAYPKPWYWIITLCSISCIKNWPNNRISRPVETDTQASEQVASVRLFTGAVSPPVLYYVNYFCLDRNQATNGRSRKCRKMFGAYYQSTWNSFELRRTSCPPVLCQTFWILVGLFTVKCAVNIKLFAGHFKVLDLPSTDILSGKVIPLSRTFFKICRTCPASPANFVYSAYYVQWLFAN